MNKNIKKLISCNHFVCFNVTYLFLYTISIYDGYTERIMIYALINSDWEHREDEGEELYDLTVEKVLADVSEGNFQFLGTLGNFSG